MSVNPRLDVAAVLGDYKMVELTRGIHIAAQVLESATLAVGKMFTAGEWERLANLLKNVSFESNNPTPGTLIAHLVERDEQLFASEQPGELGAKVRALDYLQAWAVILACAFRWRDDYRPKAGECWWELPVRWAHLRPQIEARMPGKGAT